MTVVFQWICFSIFVVMGMIMAGVTAEGSGCGPASFLCAGFFGSLSLLLGAYTVHAANLRHLRTVRGEFAVSSVHVLPNQQGVQMVQMSSIQNVQQQHRAPQVRRAAQPCALLASLLLSVSLLWLSPLRVSARTSLS